MCVCGGGICKVLVKPRAKNVSNCLSAFTGSGQKSPVESPALYEMQTWADGFLWDDSYKALEIGLATSFLSAAMLPSNVAFSSFVVMALTSPP